MSDLITKPRRRSVTSSEVRALYDRVAPAYDWYRGRWLEVAGAEAEEAMLADIAACLHPGARVLDAGCGTGALSRRMLALCPEIALTMLDHSSEMLARAADIPGSRLQGSVLDLPFAEHSFELVVSGWVIETVTDPLLAVTELLRVLAPGGRLIYTFCSLPDGWRSRSRSALLRAVIKHGFAGESLDGEHTPWHDCENSSRRRFRGGLTTEIALGKCCIVGPDALSPSALPMCANRRSA